MYEYTNRVGLLTNTFYVPPIALGFTVAAYERAKKANIPTSKIGFFLHLAMTSAATLFVTHTAFYIASNKPLKIEIIDKRGDGGD